MSYVMNNTEIRETIHEIPVIGKILDIGVKEEERTFLGEWRSTADGNRMTINENNTFIAVKADGSDPITGTWEGDDTTVVFKEDLGLLGVVADTLGVNLIGVYDHDADTITVNQPKLGFGDEVYVRIEPDESYNSLPYLGKWTDEEGIFELKEDHTVIISTFPEDKTVTKVKWVEEDDNTIRIIADNGSWSDVLDKDLILTYNPDDDTILIQGFEIKKDNAIHQMDDTVLKRMD